MDDGKKDDDEDKDKSKKKNRCAMCRKKVGLTGKNKNNSKFNIVQIIFCIQINTNKIKLLD